MTIQNSYLVPQAVFIGDSAVLHIDFSLDAQEAQLFAGTDGEIEIEALKNFYTSDTSTSEIEDYTITRIFLQKNAKPENTYSFEITFVPWTTGEIALSEFEYNGIIFAPEALTISARTANFPALSEIQMRPPKPPLLVPGTTYIIIALVMFFILFALGTAALTLHFLKKPLYYRRFLYAVKKIKQNVMRSGIAQDDFECIDKTFRKFLSIHFAKNFSSFTAAELHDFLLKIDNEKSETNSKIAESAKTVFDFCDTMRYGNKTPDADSQKVFTSVFDKMLLCASLLIALSNEAKKNVF